MKHGFQQVVFQIRRLIGRPEAGDATDRELLARFATDHDKDAFAALMARHQALVFGVCRRLLGNDHDADDAFQATFLLLARQAGVRSWRDSVAGWLYEVAYRTAGNARVQAARRRRHESQAAAMFTTPDTSAAEHEQLRQLLDQELWQLPAKYRLPLVLCYLENKTRDQAAQELGWSAGAVKGRLERGRELLRVRLSRHGLTLSVGALAALLEQEALAAVPAPLFTVTIEAAIGGAISAPVGALMKGAMRAMFWKRIKLPLLMFAALGVVGSGVGLTVYLAGAENPPRLPERKEVAVLAPPGKLETAVGLYPLNSPVLVKLSYGGGIGGWDALFRFEGDGAAAKLKLSNNATLVVTDALGKPVESRQGRLEHVEADKSFTQEFTIIVDFAKVYDLSKAGRYTIEWGSRGAALDKVSITIVDGFAMAEGPEDVGVLKLKLPGELPVNAQPNLATKNLIKQFLTGTAAERTEAETKLVESGPMAAVAAQLALSTEKDETAQKRLQDLTRKALADSPRTAKLVLTHAQALNTVAINSGTPFKFNDPKLGGMRNSAKIFYFLFVDPTPYGGELGEADFHNNDITTPFIDLPAASKLYAMSAAIYKHLAETEKDAEKAKQYRQDAETWQKKAVAIAAEAETVK